MGVDNIGSKTKAATKAATTTKTTTTSRGRIVSTPKVLTPNKVVTPSTTTQNKSVVPVKKSSILDIALGNRNTYSSPSANPFMKPSTLQPDYSEMNKQKEFSPYSASNAKGVYSNLNQARDLRTTLQEGSGGLGASIKSSVSSSLQAKLLADKKLSEQNSLSSYNKSRVGSMGETLFSPGAFSSAVANSSVVSKNVPVDTTKSLSDFSIPMPPSSSTSVSNSETGDKMEYYNGKWMTAAVANSLRNKTSLPVGVAKYTNPGDKVVGDVKKDGANTDERARLIAAVADKGISAEEVDLVIANAGRGDAGLKDILSNPRMAGSDPRQDYRLMEVLYGTKAPGTKGFVVEDKNLTNEKLPKALSSAQDYYDSKTSALVNPIFRPDDKTSPQISGFYIAPNGEYRAIDTKKAAQQKRDAQYGSGGGSGGGGGGGATPSPTSGTGVYTIEGAPTWWKGIVSDGTAEGDYAAIINNMIPFMSPEDQMTMSLNLSRTSPTLFADYANIAYDTTRIPSEITTDLRNQYTNRERGTNILDALQKLTTASGKLDADMGEGYQYMKQIGNILAMFGGTDSADMQTREQYQQMTNQLTESLNSTKNNNALSAYGTLSSSVISPYFTAGNIYPLGKDANGNWIFGNGNAQFQ